MTERYIQDSQGGPVIKLSKIERLPHTDNGNLWLFFGQRWIVSRQAFAERHNGLTAKEWVPVVLVYHSAAGQAVFVPDTRPETRAAILSEFGF